MTGQSKEKAGAVTEMQAEGSETRFGGLERLFGSGALGRLGAVRVAIAGIGGVGSWTAEALARSGAGALRLIDLDEVCVTNINRQLHALEGTVGRSKVEVMAERIGAISPACRVEAMECFFTASSADACLDGDLDLMVDAIDTVPQKAFLIAECRRRGLPVITCGGAGGKRDGTRIRVNDLAFATNDRLLKMVRKRLRAEHGFPRDEGVSFDVRAVYSEENAVYPRADGTVCATPEPGEGTRLNCDSGMGTAAFVTGAFGLAAAGEAVRWLCGGGGQARLELEEKLRIS